ENPLASHPPMLPNLDCGWRGEPGDELVVRGVDFVEVVGRHEDLAWLRTLGRSDDPFALEDVHQPRGARESDPHPALQERGGSLALAHHQPGDLVEQVVVDPPFATFSPGSV